jgi:serine protease Do
MKLDVKLGDRVTVFDSLDRNMQMSPGTTHARSGFDAVIEHDTPLEDHLMGGPLVGLDGRVVGINVARYDRAQTFAIPADLASRIAQQLMLEVRYANPEPVKAFDITGTR